MSSPVLDPQRALALIRRGVARAPGQAADGLARLVRDTPSHRLDQLMRTPARRVVLDGIFWQMPQHLDRRRAAGMRASILWRITGRADGEADAYHLEFEDGRCRVVRGPRDTKPRVTITVDGAEFLRIVTGNSDPMRAYFNGRLALAGDIMVAAKLVSLFRVPGGLDARSRT
jgi:putative sterol carrier protein